MNLLEVKEKAKELIPEKCRFCPECNGFACRGELPGLGGKQSGSTFIRNVEKLKEVKVHMNTLVEPLNVDTSSTLFDRRVSLPVYAAPIAGIMNNYGADMSEADYAQAIIEGSCLANTIGFTGDGIDINFFVSPLDSIEAHHGNGIPTMKPWAKEGIDARIAAMKDKNIMALATDIDACGLIGLRNANPPVESKSIEALKEVKQNAGIPLIIKGIMTVQGALDAVKAGADAIVVSNHGGRVLDHGLSTIEVLADIVDVVKGKTTILIDGGFRSGVDVFKALAIGADGVLIGRPLSICAIGGKAEGVKLYYEKIQLELKETMFMAGLSHIDEITPAAVYNPFRK